MEQQHFTTRMEAEKEDCRRRTGEGGVGITKTIMWGVVAH